MYNVIPTQLNALVFTKKKKRKNMKMKTFTSTRKSFNDNICAYLSIWSIIFIIILIDE